MSDATVWVGPTTDIPVVNADGNIFEEVQVATAAQTVFTLASFQYTPGTKSIWVLRKTGAAAGSEMLRRNVDYTETSSTQITLAAGATVGDILIFISFGINQLLIPPVLSGLPPAGTAGQIIVKNSSSDYDVGWQSPSSLSALLDAPRVDVASSNTVDLTAAGPVTTRNINITGNVDIAGFLIPNGELYVARFAGALNLANNANIVTQSGAAIATAPGDTCILRATALNIVEILCYSRAGSNIVRQTNDLRLTLSSGVPVPTADVLAASILYCTPYIGNKLALYVGKSWTIRECAEFSIALAGLTVNRPYDVFCYDNNGTPTLELLAWTSATARATALVRQDGVLVKSGDATRRYMGSFYALTATTTEDSARRRLVWNNNNRVSRALTRQETAATWPYTTVAFRQANANPLNQIEFMCGVQEDSIDINLSVTGANTTANIAAQVAISPDGALAVAAGSISTQGSGGANAPFAMHAKLNTQAPLGYHTYGWIEEVITATGVMNWSGTNFSGLFGHWRA